MERRPRLEFIRICLLDALGESARRVEYRGRERIYIRGGASDEVFILTAGAVKLSRESPERGCEPVAARKAQQMARKVSTIGLGSGGRRRGSSAPMVSQGRAAFCSIAQTPPGQRWLGL